MMNPVLVELLRCPLSRQRVHIAPSDIVSVLNENIAAGTVRNQLGSLVVHKIEHALLREDERFLFPVVDGIPCMLCDESIAL